MSRVPEIVTRFMYGELEFFRVKKVVEDSGRVAVILEGPKMWGHKHPLLALAVSPEFKCYQHRVVIVTENGRRATVRDFCSYESALQYALRGGRV